MRSFAYLRRLAPTIARRKWFTKSFCKLDDPEKATRKVTMKYRSSRGSSDRRSFEDILIHCYAGDGGIYLPEVIPKLSHQDLVALSGCAYVELCQRILKLYISDEEYKELQINALVEEAFTSFDCKEIIPMRNIGGINVAELWHGKSMAFKDLAVSCVSRFTETYFAKRNVHASVICATSGDTGSAIMESVRGSKFIDVFTLLPEGRCSEIQERQMTCIPEENIHSFCAQGTSDDFDTVIGNIFADHQFSAEHRVVSYSSLNWTRIMVQIVHYFFAYFQSVDRVGDLVSVVVPSGGLGNLVAGYIANLMGLPIELIAAVNQNDSAHRIFSKGDFSPPKEVLMSSSCSMDITVPPNVERILFLASEKDQTVMNLMNELKKNNKVAIPEKILEKIREVIQSASIPESRVKEAIKETWAAHAYHIEPHTAVAMAIALHPDRYNIRLSGKKIVCLSCASPQKFPEIYKQEGIPFKASENIELLLKKPTRFQHLKTGEDWMGILKNGIVAASEKFKQMENIDIL